MTLFQFDAEGASTTGRWRRVMWTSFGLVYLFIWPLSGVSRHGLSTTEIVVRLLALVSFTAAFVGLVIFNNPWTGVTTRRTWIMLGITTVLGLGYPLLLSSDWMGLPIYLGVAYAMTLPPKWAPRGVLTAAVMTLLLGLRVDAPGSTVVLLAFEALTIGMLVLGFRTSRILVVQLREARGEIARLAANEERLRIARDLHDLLGHTLSLIVLKSEVATRLADRDRARSLAEVEDIQSVARQALADVREAISGYRRRDLPDELRNARNVMTAAEIDLTVTTSGMPLPDQVDGLFGWAVREGVTNILRHSRARTATITVAHQGDDGVLEITDDGVGAEDPAESAGNGLRGLDERVASSGGTLTAGPREGGGFRLRVRVPLTAPARAAQPAGEPA